MSSNNPAHPAAEAASAQPFRPERGSQPAGVGLGDWLSARSWISKGLITLSFLATAVALALRHVGPERFALFWDDALFFKRVAYNMLHHGFAGWNQADGPVFVNTSQLFQALAGVVLALFPNHYNAAIVFWGALALTLSLGLLARAVKTNVLGVFLLLCLLQAPPLFLSMTTGMETPLVILVLSCFVLELLRAEASSSRLGLAVALQLAVYLTRPDAILMSFAAAVGLRVVRGQLREALRLGLWIAAAILLATLALYAYYGTPLPLSTFLKVTPLSIYDQDYLSKGLSNKLKNLAQLGVLLLPLLPLIQLGWDRTQLVLCGAASLFVGFHALTTYEIAAYHARFYAPCLPIVFAAALRGLPHLVTRRRQLVLLGWGVASAGVFVLAYSLDAIESARGYGPDTVSFEEYVRYLVAAPAVALLSLLPAAARVLAPALAGLGLAAVQTSRTLPAELAVVSDDVSNMQSIFSHTADVNMDVLHRCFAEPVKLTHSEIGLPGVLFLESKVIDFTGLANPEIVAGTFQFEALCENERPEFIYRPHVTHKALNQVLDQSPCLAAGYTRVKLPRRSSCPLHVRNDLLEQYQKCLR